MNGTNPGSEGSSTKPAAGPGGSSPPEPNPSPSSRSRTILFAALTVAGVWIVGLVVLAMLSANPVTLNQKQILHSDFIATATRADAETSSLLVKKEWKHAEELGQIAVANLNQTRMPKGREFLVPLQRIARGRYLITPTTLPNQAPLIYPATPEAEAQLQELLQTRK